VDRGSDRYEKRWSQQKPDQPWIKSVAVRHADPVEENDAYVLVDQIKRVTN
jgi:hypothetical protein